MTGHLYFIGIAGHAMRGLALAARDNGYTVSGLDEAAVPPGSDWLDEHKFIWARQYEPAHLKGVTSVIITGAHVSKEHPAIIEAAKRHIPVQSFAQFFGHLTEGEQVIAVAGTHGKTTTTALIAWLLESAGLAPDYLVGIQPFNFPASVRFAGAKIAVVEGDEYKASALDTKSKVQYYHPDTLVLTSAEHDHPDMYPTHESVIARFTEIVKALPAAGQLIACVESEAVTRIAESATCAVTTYGLVIGDFRPGNVAYLPGGIELDVVHRDKTLGRLAVPLYGKHNVLNLLAGTAAALSSGLTFEQIATAAATFKGAYRRFNTISVPGAPITVIDDYAHHPSEVATNLEAAKLHFPGRRIVAVFRPHTYSRTHALLADYHKSFHNADLVFITDIEGAREAGAAKSVSGQDIVSGLKVAAHFVPDRTNLITQISEAARPGDVILCFTVSGYDNLAQELATTLNPDQ